MSTLRTGHELAEHFLEYGYAVLRGVVDPAEVEALRAETKAQIDAGIGDPPEEFGKALLADGSAVQYRVDGLVKRAMVNDSVLLSSVHPAVLDVVGAILHEPFVGAEAVVFKGERGGATVPLHSAHIHDDVPRAPWSRARELCSAGIYLDDATVDSGCLLVLPRSQRMDPQEVEELCTHGLDVEGLVAIETAPGDVLVHSEFVVHGSRPTPPGGRLRRVVYHAYGDAASRRPWTGKEAVAMRRMEVAALRRRSAPYARGEAMVFSIPPCRAEAVAAVTDEQLAATLGTSARFAPVEGAAR